MARASGRFTAGTSWATGRLLRVEFRRALDGPFGAVAWEALDEDANLVSGKLVLHAAVAETEVVSWAEVTVDRR